MVSFMKNTRNALNLKINLVINLFMFIIVNNSQLDPVKLL